MTIVLNKILDLFKKEKRPLLGWEIRTKLSLSEYEELKIYNDRTKTYLESDEVNFYLPKIYIWIIEKNNTRSKRGKPYLFEKDQLEEFWFNEMTFLLRNSENELEISKIADELGKNIVAYYNLLDPQGESFKITSDAGLGENKKETLLKFLKKHSEVFYFRMKYSDSEEHWDQTYMIGLNEWLGKVLISDRKTIRNQILTILRKHPRQEMLLGDLIYALNRSQLRTLTQKPYNEILIKEILNENQGRFIFDSINQLVKKSDDLDYITSHFKLEIINYKDFNPVATSNGLLAYIFIGKDFPLKEATEYVKTRPIIFITKILNFNPNSFPIFSHHESELIKYLKLILDDVVDIKNWLLDNIALSYYEESYDQIILLESKMIEKLSPVFNVNKNPGNLFQFTLEKLLVEKGKNNI